MTIRCTHDHSGFDRADFHAVDAEVRGLLERWDGPLIEQRTERYRRCGFFALSALGCNPHQDGTIPEVLPKRVFDPFLWLLHQCGLISTVRRVR